MKIRRNSSLSSQKLSKRIYVRHLRNRSRSVFFPRCYVAQISAFLLLLFCVSINASAQRTSVAKNPLAQFEKAIDDGKFSEIESNLFNFVIANPTNAKGFALLAKLRLKQNRLSEAKSLSNKALLLDPKIPLAKIIMATADFQAGESEQSKTILESVADSDIIDNSLRLSFAQTLALVGDCTKSLTTAEKLPLKIKNGEALSFRARCYLQTDDLKSFASLIPAAKAAAKNDFALALQFAKVLNDAAFNKEAVDLLRSIAINSPQKIETYILLAKSEIALKDLASAELHLSQAEKIQPESAQIFLAESLLESARENSSKAFALLEKSLALSPDDTEILKNYVIGAILADQPGKSFRAAEKLLNLQPENAEFLYLYGASALQNNNLAKAEPALTKFTEMRPNDSRGCLALGLTYSAQPDKIEAARQQIERCLVINPNNYEATYQLGLFYKTQGENAKAIEYLEQTVKLSPDYAAALRDLGAVYLLTNSEENARLVLEKSVALNPNDADTHFQLSRLYNLIGQANLAKQHLEIFQKLKNSKKNGM